MQSKDIAKRRPPVGIDVFDKLISDGFYYVDKTGMIEDGDNRRIPEYGGRRK